MTAVDYSQHRRHVPDTPGSEWLTEAWDSTEPVARQICSVPMVRAWAAGEPDPSAWQQYLLHIGAGPIDKFQQYLLNIQERVEPGTIEHKFLGINAKQEAQHAAWWWGMADWFGVTREDRENVRLRPATAEMCRHLEKVTANAHPAIAIAGIIVIEARGGAEAEGCADGFHAYLEKHGGDRRTVGLWMDTHRGLDRYHMGDELALIAKLAGENSALQLLVVDELERMHALMLASQLEAYAAPITGS